MMISTAHKSEKQDQSARTVQCPVVVARIRAKIQRIRLSDLPDLNILIRSEPTGMRPTVTGYCSVLHLSFQLTLPLLQACAMLKPGDGHE
jgi:hypothetical protein